MSVQKLLKKVLRQEEILHVALFCDTVMNTKIVGPQLSWDLLKFPVRSYFLVALQIPLGQLLTWQCLSRNCKPRNIRFALRAYLLIQLQSIP